MRSRDGIRVTMSTAGSVTPGFATLSGGYRYQGDPDWTPGDPRFREDIPGQQEGIPLVAEERSRRVAEFGRLRESGLGVGEAGMVIGVKRKTASTYERERLAARLDEQQRGENSDG